MDRIGDIPGVGLLGFRRVVRERRRGVTGASFRAVTDEAFVGGRSGDEGRQRRYEDRKDRLA